MHGTPHIIHAIMNDTYTSWWLKEALQSSLKRDCVDAARDARYLANILEARVKEIQGS